MMEEVKKRLKGAQTPVFLTGAGVSAESGVPTFRGEEGLWRNFRPEDLATPGAFKRDPWLVWQWYDWRRKILSGVKPNAAHEALARIEKEKGAGRVTIITQNVDGLHQAAGSVNVLELHGSIWKLRCVKCAAVIEDRTVGLTEVPVCACGGLLRPGVVWFGEALPEEVFRAALNAAARADFMMVIGTSGVVQPAASLAFKAKQAGAYVAEVNPESTPLSSVMDAVLKGSAGAILPALL
ncbi:MAG: NAD-dependent deacylase [Thermodesulfobacteriota bacterium]|nr:MAG: NAD-dependent deacylase [Thermodesulfobacteriota bacterium]